MFNRILLAVDGAPHSERSLKYAEELGKKFDSEVIVAHFIKREPSRFGLEASEQSPEQTRQDFDAVGLSAKRMTPQQIAHDIDAMGPAERVTTEQQRAHDVDFVGIAAERMRPEQLAQDIDVVGVPKSRETSEQLALDRDVVGVSDETIAKWHEQAKQLVNEYADILRSAGLNTKASVEEGLADDRILQFAKDNRCDSIIIGTRREGRFGHLFGSVSQAVASKANVPVLVVH